MGEDSKGRKASTPLGAAPFRLTEAVRHLLGAHAHLESQAKQKCPSTGQYWIQNNPPTRWAHCPLA